MFGLAGLLLALIVRFIGGYPRCPSDEGNWALIAAEIGNGIDWPVSGPLHFWLMQTLAYGGDMTYQQSLAIMGVFSVPFILFLLWCGYTILDVGVVPVTGLIVLSTSSYFLAPLLESRPQQLGQALVFLGLVLLWRAVVEGSSWWPYMAVIFMTGLWHILSFGILIGSSLAVWSILFVVRQASVALLGKLLLACLPGLMIFIVPNGPYAMMLKDVLQNQFRVSGGLYAWVAATVFLGLTLVVLRHHLNKSASVWRVLATWHAGWMAVCVVTICIAVLVFQASLLPPQAWVHYGGSTLLFLVSQSGNLFFATLFLFGLVKAYKMYQHDQTNKLFEAVAVLLAAMGLVAMTALVGSMWTLDSNWMLRVLNYSIFLMASFAGLSFKQIQPSQLKWGLWLIFSSVSLTTVIRPVALFVC